jgi:hypothetical protein
VDEGRKRVIGIMAAAILASLHMQTKKRTQKALELKRPGERGSTPITKGGIK